jgi:hypothetical protein
MRPCPLSVSAKRARPAAGAAANRVSISPAQAGLVGLDGQEIVGAGLAHGARHGAVARDGIDAHEAALKPTRRGEALEQHRDGRDLVGFARDHFLAEHQTAGGGEGRDQMPRCPAGAAVVAAPGGLAGEGDEFRPLRQQARTQPVKALANRAGLIRFIMIVSQRPVGTP